VPSDPHILHYPVILRTQPIGPPGLDGINDTFLDLFEFIIGQ
jgi:hypothetical protein